MIKQLEKEFEGTGSVSGIKYAQIYFCIDAFLYECMQNGIITHFEVFERKIVPLCIDFEKKIFSETDFKEIYPKNEDFGVWAWTFKSFEKAKEKYLQIVSKSE